VTAYAYDAADRLISITPPAALAGAASFGLDALGRIRTRTVTTSSDTSTDTYSFIGDPRRRVGS
jgi:hypothetical protein